MSRRIKYSLVLLLTLLFPLLTFATEPCAPAVCRDDKGNLLTQKCYYRSDWIVVGKIANIVHHPEGMPLDKDFAEFDLQVVRLEKGVKPEKTLHFKVGWCDNRQELPADTAGEFRFYGSDKAADGGGLQYLDFDSVK